MCSKFWSRLKAFVTCILEGVVDVVEDLDFD